MPFHVLIEQRKKIKHSTVAGFEIVDENEREVTRRVQSTKTKRYREKARIFHCLLCLSPVYLAFSIDFFITIQQPEIR